jgi:hypothetical protein
LAVADDDERPEYQHGIGMIGGTQFHWGSGMPGKYWSIPYGDYPVTPNAPTGAWAHQVGAIPINDNVIPDPQLGRNRIGIMIHSGSAPALDQLYTEGCFKVDPQDWPNVRSQILAEADKGPLYLHVAPGGVAAFTNTKTFSQAGGDTPAANANASANTSANPSASPSAQGTTINTTGPDFYATAMQHESGGKNIPNAAGGWGAAGGYYQFTPATYAGIRAARPDLNLPANIQDASQDQQTAAYHELTRQNAAALQSANLPVNDKNVFMGSFLGGAGATKFLVAMNQNPDANAAAMFPTEAKANPTVFYDQGQPRSLQQVYALQTGPFGSGNTTGFGTNLNTTAPASAAPPAGGLGAAITALNQGTGAGGKGPSALDTAAKMFDPPQQQAPPPAPIPQAPPLERFNPGAQQLMLQLLARNAKPLSWGTAPFGSTGTGLQPAGQQASPQGDLSQLSQWETWQRMQQAGLGSPVPPGVPGTTLNSAGDSYV